MIMRIVQTTDELRALTQELAGAPYLALDTEFMRDQTYWPKLCLIQIAAPGTSAIIDPLAEGMDLTPFYDLLRQPGVVKVLHAARQDLEIFSQQGGVIPEPLFDTQIAAMVCGFGDAASYETLARKLAKVEIDKSARYSDWSHRPLSKRQLEYAMADVTHLCTIYEAMTQMLARTGRASWVEEEIEALRDPALYRLDPKESWRRLKPRTSNKRFLAMLAALAEWRFAASRLGKGLLEAIELGRHAAPPDGIEPRPPQRRREPSPAAIDLLKTLLRLKAEEVGVAPRLIADSDDIEKLAAQEDDGVAALHGWRAHVFGNDALALRKGELAIALEGGRAVVVELEEE
jgi:ribonuclease D